jgi:gas vesicle protein
MADNNDGRNLTYLLDRIITSNGVLSEEKQNEFVNNDNITMETLNNIYNKVKEDIENINEKIENNEKILAKKKKELAEKKEELAKKEKEFAEKNNKLTAANKFDSSSISYQNNNQLVQRKKAKCIIS